MSLPTLPLGSKSTDGCICANTNCATQDIYGHGSPCTKDIFYQVLSDSHYHLADVIGKGDHGRKRKILSSAYAVKNLETWEHKVADKAIWFLKSCDATCTTPLEKRATVDPVDLKFDYCKYAFLTQEAIVDIGLSDRLGFLDKGTDAVTAESPSGKVYTSHYVDALHSTALTPTVIVFAYDWYKFNTLLSKIVSPTFRHLWKVGDTWSDIVYHAAKKRLALYRAGEKLDDFFQALMEDKNGNAHNSEWGEIVAECSIMMDAGSDTTAIAMANAIYLLATHPEVLEKLRGEVDDVLDAEETVAPYDKVKHLPYLRAVLDKGLRMMPPVSFSLPRRTPAEVTSS
jgi:hypothetical protein